MKYLKTKPCAKCGNTMKYYNQTTKLCVKCHDKAMKLKNDMLRTRWVKAKC
jgi:hypothetical protein